MTALADVKDALGHLVASKAYHELKAKGENVLRGSHLGKCERDLQKAILELAPPKPAHDYGLLAGSGWFLRDHSSGNEIEKTAAVKACPTFKYLALNIDSLNFELEWQTWRNEASIHGIPTLPWGRCYKPTDVHWLHSIALQWNSPGVILNIEDESETTLTPAIVNFLTRDWHGSLAICTDYRGYHDPDGTYKGPDWSVLADRAVGFMEAFDNTATKPISVAASLQRLEEMGFKKRMVMPSTKLKPIDYPGLTYRAPYVLDLVDAAHVKDWS